MKLSLLFFCADASLDAAYNYSTVKDQPDVTSDAGSTTDLITTDVSPEGNYKALFYNMFMNPSPASRSPRFTNYGHRME